MTLRTPRRRISPRTIRRYRAIKEFLRRALGTSSQTDIKTTSSIEVSVSDLKNKIVGIEQQLNKVSKHCRDLACFEHSFRKERDSSVQLQQNDELTLKQDKSNRKVSEFETELLYESSHSKSEKPNESANALINNTHEDIKNMRSTSRSFYQNNQQFQLKPEKIKSRRILDENNYTNLLERQRSIPVRYEKQIPILSSSSCHSLLESRNRTTGHHHENRRSRKECSEHFIVSKKHKDRVCTNNIKNHDTMKRYDDRHNRKKINEYSALDKEFISDIIRRQYKPVKLFGRRDSDFSQFSAPVCRDQEFTIRDQMQEGSELCSCCFEENKRHKHRYIRNADLSDLRSICDTRLYSSKKRKRNKYTKHYFNNYNDSNLYDVIPVKERSSPKSRRKFAEDNMITYQYKEVPPSPKSHRPQLNLKVQRYTDYEDNSVHRKRKKSPVQENQMRVINNTESDVSSDSYQKIPATLNNFKPLQPQRIQEEVGTMSSLQCPTFLNEQTNRSNNDTTLNTQATNSTDDKADKTLCEIKDILQSFLQEIKKESTHSEQSEGTSKIETKQVAQHQESTKITTGIMPNSGHSSFNNYSVGSCGLSPFLQAFPNHCCYPVLPMCPMNCLQNGYIMPSPSYTCNVCAKNLKDPDCLEKESYNSKSRPCEEMNMNDETQELIKEIYKFVSQKPKSPRLDEEYCNENSVNNAKNEQSKQKKYVTNRSVSASVKASKHDANVGTPNLKYYSKSCEAIGSRNTSDTYNTTNGSYSDTLLEKLSLEATQSSSESDLSTHVLEKKFKRNKLKNVLRKLRLFKKKKNDVIEEVSESESTVEVDDQPQPVFEQNITNYAMYGQEHFHPPPMPDPHCFHPPSDCYRHSYDPRYHHIPPLHECYDHKHHNHQQHAVSSQWKPPKYATAPPYPNYGPNFNQLPPQVPFCLKEIEVKSIGTQSERKVSILEKFAKKIPTPKLQENEPKFNPPPAKEKPSLWKTLQEKAKQNNPDPMDFSLKTQKRLAHGDLKLRNAMIKKLFYKRNPFSPRNLIIRTLLGKDKSSYGEPPKMYRPRMFL